jgi:glutamyl-tRNA synthetase
MGISHVIRGADHHMNTALQLAIYAALERTPPRFAHLPLIVNHEGKKLSKRRDPVSVQRFRDEGYLPEALCNWLARIGWSHGDQEIFAMGEIRERFDLAGVHRSAGQAEPGKLAWLNQHWIKSLPGDVLFERARPFFEAEAGRPVAQGPALARLVDLLRERSKTLVEMARLARFFLVDEVTFDEAAARKHLRPELRPVLEDLAGRLARLQAWDEKSLEGAFEAAGATAGLALGKLAQPVRVAVTGTAVSPGIFETLAVLGRERSLARIGTALARLA